MPTREASTSDAASAGGVAPQTLSWRARADRFDQRFPRGRIMLVLAALVLVLNVTSALRVDQLSRIDETYWVDHLLHGADFSIDRNGEPILQETVREKCERGQDEKIVPPCERGHLDPSKYGYWHDVNITGARPFYFWVTGPIARVLRATPIDLAPHDSLVTWARLLGTAWLLVGLYLLLRAGEILGVRRRMLAVACVFVAATPALLHADTIVNPDATAMVAGAGILLAALSWERRGSPLWLLGAVALGLSLFNEKNAIAIILVLLFLGIRALAGYLREADDEDLRRWQDYAKACAVLVVALFLANKGWDWFYEWIRNHVFTAPHLADITGNPIARAYGNRGIAFWDLFGPNTVFMMFPPFHDIALPHPRNDPFYLVFAQAAELVTIGAMIAVALRDKIANKVSTLGFALLATLLVSPTLYVVRNQIDGGTFDQPVWRYGLAAVPAIAIVLAVAPKSRFAERALVVLAAALYVSAIYVVL